jgi:AraC-like DNA-binding protein
VGLTGPASRAHQTQAGRDMVCFGVRLRPGALEPLFGLAPPQFAGRMASPSELPRDLVSMMETAAAVGTWAESVQSLDMLLLDRAAAAVDPDPVTARTALRLARDFDVGRIGKIAADEGLSPRHLRRRFLAAAGMTPKAYAQARRMRLACMLMLSGTGGWSAVAAGAGFADQAHLIREFGDKLQLRPRAAEAYLRRIRHVFADGVVTSHSFNPSGDLQA